MMTIRIVACGTALLVAVFTAVASAQVEVLGSATSRVTDVTANPNVVNNAHSFDNTTLVTALTPTTTSSSAAMANGTASGSVTASEGFFNGFATSFYSNTGLNEYAETNVRASASDLLTITSVTLAPNTPVTLNFALGISGTLTSPERHCGRGLRSVCDREL